MATAASPRRGKTRLDQKWNDICVGMSLGEGIGASKTRSQANIETEEITSSWPGRRAFVVSVVVVVARVPGTGKMEIIFRATSVDA